MTAWLVRCMTLCCLVGLSGVVPTFVSSADRDKLLAEPGVFGTFVAYRIDPAWAKLDQSARIAQLTFFRGVIEQYRENLAIDTYLLRGLSDHADILLRVHATDLRQTQQFLVDLQASLFGKYLGTVALFHGLSRQANYVPGFPEPLKDELTATSESGPYAIVIPIRKDAEWWSFPQDQRAGMMREHTEAAMPYHKTVKRKLYHSTGLDDFDFITYFETAKLDDFQGLILSLQKVKEARHNRRFGHPTLVGTAKSVDQLIETLAQ
jgi:chlorite dismutase